MVLIPIVPRILPNFENADLARAILLALDLCLTSGILGDRAAEVLKSRRVARGRWGRSPPPKKNTSPPNKRERKKRRKEEDVGRKRIKSRERYDESSSLSNNLMKRQKLPGFAREGGGGGGLNSDKD